MSVAELMDRYQVDSLVVDPDEFQAYIQSLPGTVYGDDPRQREFENVFTWGHDHDFGPFQMKGQMGDRHIRVIDSFIDMGVEFEGDVLDVGCWTGGTSLLLAAMGYEVTAIEEVEPYAWAAEYLASAFGLDNLYVMSRSLYDLDYREMFDVVLCAGVLYHVSDPVRALHILFEALRDGGKLLLETEVTFDERPVLIYEGQSQPGWRWLVPSPPALDHMLVDVGFRIEHWYTSSNRAMVVAVRDEYVSMTRAGVAV